MKRLLLGPIVGHTDHASSTIWIRIAGDPSDYELRVLGQGLYPFTSTEPGGPEFGTALAVADGLRPEWAHRYRIMCRGRALPGASGTFRTMPAVASPAEVLFVTLSCSHNVDLGLWPLLSRYVTSNKPRFLIMLGDQLYVDERGSSQPSVWKQHLESKPAVRRQALADKYQEQWSREPLRTILANTPTYMMWDDHEIRNGWGSFAPDSPTLAARYPKGADIADLFSSYFEDARDVFFHFQACRNPPPPAALSFPPPDTRRGTPFLFRCGRLGVLVLDNRGARDLWRAKHPILGDDQWQFLAQAIAGLPADLDALAVVIPLPITSMDPEGSAQKLLGDRIDDIDLFKEGRKAELVDFTDHEFFSSPTFNHPGSAASAPLVSNIGNLKLSNLTDTRDVWSNHLCREEQAELIRAVVGARTTNRLKSQPRQIVFIGGDLHAGAVFELSLADPKCTIPSLVTSGIAKQTGAGEGIVGVLMDEDFDIADGIHATLKRFTNVYNFGALHLVFGGNTAILTTALAHAGDASFWTLKLP